MHKICKMVCGSVCGSGLMQKITNKIFNYWNATGKLNTGFEEGLDWIYGREDREILISSTLTLLKLCVNVCVHVLGLTREKRISSSFTLMSYLFNHVNLIEMYILSTSILEIVSLSGHGKNTQFKSLSVSSLLSETSVPQSRIVWIPGVLCVKQPDHSKGSYQC